MLNTFGVDSRLLIAETLEDPEELVMVVVSFDEWSAKDKEKFLAQFQDKRGGDVKVKMMVLGDGPAPHIEPRESWIFSPRGEKQGGYSFEPPAREAPPANGGQDG